MRLRELTLGLHEVTGRLRYSQKHVKQAGYNKNQMVVIMDPNEFLKMTTKTDEDIEDIKQNARSLLFYNREAKPGGDILIMPFLNIEVELHSNGQARIGRIKGHEGRHRAAALIAKGGREFPVSIKLDPKEGVLPKANRSPNKYDDPIYSMSSIDLPQVVRAQYRRLFFRTNGWKAVHDDLQKSTRRWPDSKPVAESKLKAETLWWHLTKGTVETFAHTMALKDDPERFGIPQDVWARETARRNFDDTYNASMLGIALDNGWVRINIGYTADGGLGAIGIEARTVIDGRKALLWILKQTNTSMRDTHGVRVSADVGGKSFYLSSPEEIRSFLSGQNFTESVGSNSVKFWVNSQTGILELLDSEDEHEMSLPGDGSLGFEASLKAGWVRGGSSDVSEIVHLQASDFSVLSKAVARTLKNFAPQEIEIEWFKPKIGFVKMTLKQATMFARNGVIPRGAEVYGFGSTSTA